jgi:N-sulfoglucosamine sulfohydrolase
MSGLTWKAMAKAAENDPALAKRVKHYLYRTLFEFYDYEKDPDALGNLIGDDQHVKLVDRYAEELLKVMKKTKDHETARYQNALGKISK